MCSSDLAQEYETAIRLKPTHKLRFMRATLLPPIYESLADVQRRREQLQGHVRRLAAEGLRLDAACEEVPTVFYLTYHGLDNLPLIRELNRLVVVSDQDPRARLPVRRTRDGKIQLGFASKYLKRHTIGELMRGIIAGIDRREFHVTVLSVGCHGDPVADAIRQSADRYVELPTHIGAARQMVVELQLDVLFYTDLGMDWLSHTLAYSRLAPVQCVTWGHPDTTGSDAIDYFISSELFETPNSDAYYSERLVRLPHVPAYCYRPAPASALKDREAFGFSADDHLYACPQSLFKLHPEFDSWLGAILERDPRGLLLLVNSNVPAWDELARRRLAQTLPHVADRIRWIPRMSHDEFLGLCAASDVLLDPPHFNGGNTSYKALAYGTPIVTLPGAFLRSRMTHALYQQMNLFDAVAQTPAEYIDLALNLASDRPRQQALREKILAANAVLYENPAPIRELEAFFKQACDAAGEGMGR